MSAGDVDAPQVRSCLVKKDRPEQEYGFNLHADSKRGQFLGEVDDLSPAAVAGLKQNDTILAVNGTPVAGMPHRQVVDAIRSHPCRCELLVADPQTLLWYRERGSPLDAMDAFTNVVYLPADRSRTSTGNSGAAKKPADCDSASVSVCREHASSHASTQRSNGAVPPAVATSTMRHEEHTHCDLAQHQSNVPVEPTVEAPTPPPVTELNSSTTTRDITSNGAVPHSQRLVPRLCRLRKQRQDDEYGFNLHAETRDTGHFIGVVDQELRSSSGSSAASSSVVQADVHHVATAAAVPDAVPDATDDTRSKSHSAASPDKGSQGGGSKSRRSTEKSEHVEESVERPEPELSFPQPPPPIEVHPDDDQQPEVRRVVANSAERRRTGTGSSKSSQQHQATGNGHANGSIGRHSNDGGDSGGSPAAVTANQRDSSAHSVTSADLDFLNCSAAELRARLASRHKRDVKAANMTMSQKYDIVNQM